MVEEAAAVAVGMVLPGEGGILLIGVGALEESLEEVRTEGALEEDYQGKIRRHQRQQIYRSHHVCPPHTRGDPESKSEQHGIQARI